MSEMKRLDERLTAIRRLNDLARRGLANCRYMLTASIAAMTPDDVMAITKKVRDFDQWDEAANDPYGEHDFGKIEHNGLSVFWKIDYYAPDLEHGSEDPSDPDQCARVLTVMRADEY